MNNHLPSLNVWKTISWKNIGVTACVLVISVGVGFDAAAQSKRDVRALEKKIEQLEKQLKAVQRKVFPGGDLATDGQTVVVTEDRTASSRALLADMEIRIGRIETQLRLLTGEIEEFQHRQDVMERRLDNFSKDVEMRFGDLETGAAPAVQPGAGAARAMDETLATGTTPTGLVRTETPAAAEALLTEGAVAEPVVTPVFATAKEQYDGALALLRRGDYAGAEGAFQAFLSAHDDHELAGNAQYWLGESYYVRKDFPRAASAFLKGYQQYGEGAKGPDSLLKLGMSLGSMGKVAEACEVFSEVEAQFPEARVLKTASYERSRLGCS